MALLVTAEQGGIAALGPISQDRTGQDNSEYDIIRPDDRACACRLQQGRLVRRQTAKEKLRTPVAPLVTAEQGSQAGIAALGPISQDANDAITPEVNMCACRLQQGRLVRRQAAREKLRTLVAPLVTAEQGSQAGIAALGPIRPRITVSFQVRRRPVK